LGKSVGVEELDKMSTGPDNMTLYCGHRDCMGIGLVPFSVRWEPSNPLTNKPSGRLLCQRCLELTLLWLERFRRGRRPPLSPSRQNKVASD